MKKRVYYYHTDAGGVVYYGRYLEFLEEARSEYLQERGLMLKELAAEGILFVVSRQEIDYKAPAVYGDILDIETRVANMGAAKIEFAYEIRNQDKRLLSTAKTTLVCVDKTFKPQAFPPKLRDVL